MPDKECTTSLLELAFAVGQLRANPKKPREYLGSMGEMLAGWECRKSGDDGKAFDGLQAAIDKGARGAGDDATSAQVDNIFKEYHSLLLAMGYLDLEQIGQPKRAPVPEVGFKDGDLLLTDFRLSTTGTGRKGFTDYRQVKTAKPTTAETPETPEPAAPRAPQPRTGRNMFMSECLADATKGASQGGERMKNCSAEWRDMDKRKRNTWDKKAATANAAAGEAGGAAWGYNNETQRRGASRWTPQNARNSILG
tara:strand:- start:1297 stop:2052 length:756 start_codon:yes stop_codon:yes gene_type:complete